ncbi:MAG: Rieske 2Fe-2S domain-containing protein [Gemmatimonadetes bacterium]|nr:Rieske 2Fe-2S domain-containing protein [Gemmatimonadota bacterium]
MTDHDCTTCPVDAGRREFVRSATLAVAAALAGLGASPRMAEALEVREVHGTRALGAIKYPIPAADSVQIDKGNEVILIRWEGKILACSLSCPHQNTSLRWSEPDKRFICPKHKSNYTPIGLFIEGRATRGMDRLAITRAGNEVTVDPEKLYKEDEDAAEWKAAILTI